MNRYPVWKYIIILITLVVGVLYTLPNFFGEAPAVPSDPTAPPVVPRALDFGDAQASEAPPAPSG